MNKENKLNTVVVTLLNGKKITLEFNPYDLHPLMIKDGCLMITDPESYSPREVHAFPLTSIEQFVFDAPKT